MPAARLALAATFALSALATGALAQTPALPDRLSDQEFWKLSDDLSEAPGFFRSENLLSNETAFQYVIPGLLRVPREGRVYLGVAPEQNFSYIAAIKPRIAFIVDIRKGNKLEHLLYKSLFELSADRAEFVSRLFSKPRPAGLDTTTTVDSIFNAYWYIATDTAMYRRNKEAVKTHLTRTHGFALSEADWADLVWVYDQFYYYGPSITYSSSGGSGGGGMPSYDEIMRATDGTGLNRGFLAKESTFRWLKEMQLKNLIVPVVGDFAGPKAIRSVGAWVKARNGIVTAIYASNVEQYLWQDGKAFAYYDNVAQLPIDSTSVFVRSNGASRVGTGGMRSPNVICSVERLLAETKAGNVYGYGAIFNYCQY
jgi:hypothetical protein